MPLRRGWGRRQLAIFSCSLVVEFARAPAGRQFEPRHLILSSSAIIVVVVLMRGDMGAPACVFGPCPVIFHDNLEQQGNTGICPDESLGCLMRMPHFYTSYQLMHRDGKDGGIL